VVNRPKDELAFPSPQGAVLRNRNARAAWFDEATGTIGEPGLTPHELRHTAASLAISAGANVTAVQRMLGHASAAMTLDRHADLANTLRTFCGPLRLSDAPRRRPISKNRRSNGLSKEWRRGESNP
jgi:integrase